MSETNTSVEPATPPETCDKALGRIIESVGGGVRRVLVIDDNASIHDDFRKVLGTRAGDDQLSQIEADLFGESNNEVDVEMHYEIAHAYQGQEGFELVQRAVGAKRPFDMAFVDMRMPPGWDGIKTIENLWQADPDLQIVICSAYSDYPLSDIRRRLGIHDKLLILKKPFENSEVCQLAATLTEKRRLARKANMRMTELLDIVEQQTNELKRISRMDVLTELLNRRGLYEEIESLHGGDELCVLMIDIDWFKKINDQFGHSKGDEVLKVVCAYIAQLSDGLGIAGRLGGDEFLVLLPQKNIDDGREFAESLRRKVDEHCFEFDGREIHVSISIGVAEGTTEACLDRIIIDADEALYAAKSAGRNNVGTSDKA